MPPFITTPEYLLIFSSKSCIVHYWTSNILVSRDFERVEIPRLQIIPQAAGAGKRSLRIIELFVAREEDMKAKLFDPTIVSNTQEALDFTGDILESQIVVITR
jgi:hypothetical protein